MPFDSVGIEVVQDSKTNLRKKLKNCKKKKWRRVKPRGVGGSLQLHGCQAAANQP